MVPTVEAVSVSTCPDECPEVDTQFIVLFKISKIIDKSLILPKHEVIDIQMGAIGVVPSFLSCDLGRKPGACNKIGMPEFGIQSQVVPAHFTALVPTEAEAGSQVETVPESCLDLVHSDNVRCAQADRSLICLNHQHVLVFRLGQGTIETLAVG